jgi:hypothetical protein
MTWAGRPLSLDFALVILMEEMAAGSAALVMVKVPLPFEGTAKVPASMRPE